MNRLYSLLIAVAVLAAPATAQTLSDAVEAYVWGNDPTAASYTPSTTYAYNVSGGVNTVARTDVGRYTVTLGGIPSYRDDNLGNVQVSAYGSNAVCGTGGWDSEPVQIRVICRDPATDAFVDSRYTVLYTRSSGSAPLVAYSFASQEAELSYAPNEAQTHNPAGGPVAAFRVGDNNEVYGFGFEGFPTRSAFDPAGHMQVTAGGTTATGGAARCGARAFGTTESGQLGLNIQCIGVDGAPLVARHSALYLQGESDGGGPALGYVHANDRTAASYTPAEERAFVQAGGAVTARRAGVGSYRLTFAGLGGDGVAGGTAQVTAFSQEGGYCTIGRWDSGGADADVYVDCFDFRGTSADQEYMLLFAWPENVVAGVATEGIPDTSGLRLAMAGPNPVAARSAVRLTLSEAADARVSVVDLLGREVAVLADRPLATGTTRLDLDASALPAGVYVVRAAVGDQRGTLRFTVIR